MATPTQKRLVQKRLADIREAKNTTWPKWFKWTGFSGKTLWDWLSVLIIPTSIALATIMLSVLQFQLADIQHRQDQQNANLQHEQDQASALDQQRATILQTYIDNIQDLLLNHNLLKSKSGDDVAILARARTLTALQGLDPRRKVLLVQFIYEAHLIGFVDSTGKPHNKIIDLNNADLSNVILIFANLKGANFSGADFREADIISTFFNNANLSRANLRGADIINTFFNNADLSDANLVDTNLSDTDFRGAKLPYAFLNNANLSRAGLIGTDLSSANLSNANLSSTFLRGAILNDALQPHFLN